MTEGLQGASWLSGFAVVGQNVTARAVSELKTSFAEGYWYSRGCVPASAAVTSTCGPLVRMATRSPSGEAQLRQRLRVDAREQAGGVRELGGDLPDVEPRAARADEDPRAVFSPRALRRERTQRLEVGRAAQRAYYEQVVDGLGLQR
jgi:hypothetical protein